MDSVTFPVSNKNLDDHSDIIIDVLKRAEEFSRSRR